MMKKITLGILAHVDGGKTTLSESFLLNSGTIKTAGRVDHGDAFLDTYEMEKKRGITIFSKQAKFVYKDLDVTLLDTPGHVDFAGEMERVLNVLDVAVLVISATDGVQSHTRTLISLLEKNKLPFFVFVNKMDLYSGEKSEIIDKLKNDISTSCVDFTVTKDEVFFDELCGLDEASMEEFLDQEKISDETISAAIKNRNVFPVFFGSALKNEGVEELLEAINLYYESEEYDEEKFGAVVFKVSRDEKNERMTWLKLYGGKLIPRMSLENTGAGEPEKINQIKVYSGEKCVNVNEATGGDVVAVSGLSKTYPGQILGEIKGKEFLSKPVLIPIMTYDLLLPEGVEPVVFLGFMKELEEEDPLLSIGWNEREKKISVQLMGEVQTQVIRDIIWQRKKLDVEFVKGHIIYKETVAAPVIGVGHYEPLRHYAEVQLLIEPGEAGSGISISSLVSEDMLEKNWQRLIMTHIKETVHPGVLTGSALTDVKISIVAGRAHEKHTEGGDFRQSTYRAIRQGLMKAKCLLLEPYYDFILDVPQSSTGRAMNDITKMNGKFEGPEPIENGRLFRFTGEAPVSEMMGYSAILSSYSRGEGRLFVSVGRYHPVKNPESIIEEIGYDAESDMTRPPSSVFCSHGSGFVVPWELVDSYKHTEAVVSLPEENNLKILGHIDVDSFDEAEYEAKFLAKRSGSKKEVDGYAFDKELTEIFERTFGSVKKRTSALNSELGYESDRPLEKTVSYANKVKKPEDNSFTPPSDVPVDYLIVDGYNIIFANERLKILAGENLDAARDSLNDMLCNYQGYKGCKVVVVYDAYKRKGNAGMEMSYGNIDLVFTKTDQTADMYIEAFVRRINSKKTNSKKLKIVVATNDSLEQLTISSGGAYRMSATELFESMTRAGNDIRRITETNKATH